MGAEPGHGRASANALAAFMNQDATNLVIELDEQGIEMLRTLAGPRSRFRVTTQADGSICLHPMSADDAELWQSGLADQIVEGFSHADRMIRLKRDKL